MLCRTRRASLAALLPLLPLVACSSSSQPTADGGSTTAGCPTTNTVNGTLAGNTLSSGAAVGILGLADSAYPNQLTVVLANQSNVCALVQTLATSPNVSKANVIDLAFTLGATSSSAPPVTPGTYTASGPNELTAGYDVYSATCVDTQGGQQTAGQVVLCSVGTTYTGSFDLTFGADHVTGTFVAPSCVIAPDAGGASGDGGMVCEP